MSTPLGVLDELGIAVGKAAACCPTHGVPVPWEQLADLLKIARALSWQRPLGHVHGSCVACRYCDGLGQEDTFQHKPDCAWVAARKLGGF